MLKHFRKIIVILLVPLLAVVGTMRTQNQKTIVITTPNQGFVNDLYDSDTSNFGEKGGKQHMNDRDVTKFLIPERDDDFTVVIDYPGLNGQPSPNADFVKVEPFVPSEAVYLVNQFIEKALPTGSRRKLKNEAPGSSPYQKYVEHTADQNGVSSKDSITSTKDGAGIQDGITSISSSSTTVSGSIANGIPQSGSGSSVTGTSETSSSQLIVENGIVTQNTSTEKTTILNGSTTTISTNPSSQQTSSTSISTSPEVANAVLASINSSQAETANSLISADIANGANSSQTRINGLGSASEGFKKDESSVTSTTTTNLNTVSNKQSQVSEGSQPASSSANQVGQTSQGNNLISANGATNVGGSGSGSSSSTSSTSNTSLTAAQVLGITQSTAGTRSEESNSIISQVLGTQQSSTNLPNEGSSNDVSLFKPFSSNSNRETSQEIEAARKPVAVTRSSSGSPTSVINSVIVPRNNLQGNSDSGTAQADTLINPSIAALTTPLSNIQNEENFIGFPKRSVPDEGTSNEIVLPNTNTTLSTNKTDPTKSNSGSFFKLSTYTMAAVLLSLLV